METWTKLYQRILHSSVWKFPSDVRIVWITLLALKDENGYVMGTPGWLADQALVPLESCKKALKIFLSPDERSRTPDNDGRKLKEVDGGWIILNHFLYRDGIEVIRDKWRRQKRQQRRRMKVEPGNPPTMAERNFCRTYESKGVGGDAAADGAGKTDQQAIEDEVRESRDTRHGQQIGQENEAGGAF